MISRQITRQENRAVGKAALKRAKFLARKQAKKALLDRQSQREASGFYEGRRSVGTTISLSRSRVNSRKVQKAKPFGRILNTIVRFGREIQLHATKGFRSFRGEA